MKRSNTTECEDCKRSRPHKEIDLERDEKVMEALDRVIYDDKKFDRLWCEEGHYLSPASLDYLLKRVILTGKRDYISTLISRGANINALDNNGFSILYLLISRSDWDRIFELLELPSFDFGQYCGKRGLLFDILATKSFPGCTSGDKRLYFLRRVLIETCMNVRVCNEKGETPLHLATHSLIADELIRFGCDVNARDPEGRTPLHSACTRGRPEVVDLLLREGADVFAKDQFDLCPLDYTLRPDKRSITPLLLRWGASTAAMHDGDAELYVLMNPVMFHAASSCYRFMLEARLLQRTGTFFRAVPKDLIDIVVAYFWNSASDMARVMKKTLEEVRVMRNASAAAVPFYQDLK